MAIKRIQNKKLNAPLAAAGGQQLPSPSLGLRALALAALAAAALGSAVVAAYPWSGLACFMAAGLLLHYSLSQQQRREFSLLQRPLLPRQAWEPWFAVGLALFSAWLYTWRLDSLAEGAIYSEGFLFNRATEIWVGPYVAHDSFAGTNWPTLYHYQAQLVHFFLGDSPAHFRLISAFYGLVLVFAVWLAARALTSPPVAAITACCGWVFTIASTFRGASRRCCCPVCRRCWCWPWAWEPSGENPSCWPGPPVWQPGWACMPIFPAASCPFCWPHFSCCYGFPASAWA